MQAAARGQLVTPFILAGTGVSSAMSADIVRRPECRLEFGHSERDRQGIRRLQDAALSRGDGIATVVAALAETGNFGSAQACSEKFALAIGACGGISLVEAVVGAWLTDRSDLHLAHANAKA